MTQVSGPLASALYEGTVVHTRLRPRRHEFTFPLFMTYLDLDEIDDVLGRHPLWSTRRWHPVQFRRSDYLGPEQQPLGDAVRDLVASECGTRPEGPVRMLTHLRTFGWLFNPITLYFCFEPGGERVRWIVAEVTNTPWHERHAYVIETDPDAPSDHWFAKSLHVSPFMALDQRYRLLFTVPGDHLTVRLENHEAGRRLAVAVLSLRRRPIGHRSLGSVLWRFPLLTLRVSVGIRVQALRLWLKRIPVHRHIAGSATTRRLAMATKTRRWTGSSNFQ